MTCFAIVLLAALNASGLIRSPNQINTRDGVNLEKLSKSSLDGLSAEEKCRRQSEHDRVGRELADLLGFEFGKPLADYAFKPSATQSDDPAFPLFDFEDSHVGFPSFRPLVVLGRLCGVLLTRPLARCEDEEDRQAVFAEADFTVRTNLATVVGLSTNNLSVATNGVPHAWRISLERWRESQVLHIGDGELASRLVRAAKAEAEAARQAQIRQLMNHEETGGTK